MRPGLANLRRARGHGNTITGRLGIAEDGTNYATDFDLFYCRVDT